MTQKRKEPSPYAPAPGEVSGEAKRAGFKLAPEQAVALAQYITLLLKWNRAMNLVGRADWPGVFRDLAADSLHLAEFVKGLAVSPQPLTLDLGAGAGLPGIPLRVLWPEGDYVLVEVREKRAIFLAQTVAAMKLARTFVQHGRAEVALAGLAGLGLSQPRERADLVLSRAFMPWPKLLPLAAELLAPGGRLVVLANDPPPAELGAELGAGLILEAALEYPADGRSRYFWSLAPARP